MQNMKKLYCERCYDGDMTTLTRIDGYPEKRWVCEYCAADATPVYRTTEDDDGEEDEDVEAEPEADKPPIVLAPDSSPPPELVDMWRFPDLIDEAPPRKRRPSVDAEEILTAMRRQKTDDDEVAQSPASDPSPEL